MDNATTDQIIITKGITMINQLNDGHVIKTMMKEHEHILIILDELEELGLLLSDTDEKNYARIVFKINQLTRIIISAEPHHKREEEVLFPVLKDKGAVGPTQHMEMEHEIMREIKYKLKEGENIIEIKAISLGTSPPNTSRIELVDSKTKYPVITQLTLDKSAIITIMK